MFLSRFGVKNYKCLGEIDIPLTPIHVLIGENDAGKTSLLEAMDAFHASSKKQLPDVFQEPWYGRELVRQASPEPQIGLSGEWTVSEGEILAESHTKFRYGFEVDFPPMGEGKNCMTQGDWIETDGERRSLWRNVAAREHTGLEAANRGMPIHEAKPNDVESIQRVLRPSHKYSLDPTVMAIPAAFDPERRFRLDPDGFGLATLLDDILSYDLDIFVRVRTQFCRFFPQFKNVFLQTENALRRRQYDPSGMHHSDEMNGKAIHFLTETDQSIRAQQASDGAILFLGFLALAHLPEPPSLLLIEEPENGVYPKRLGQVITLLKELVDQADNVRFPQIIISTHSPYVLSFFEPEEVTFLSRPTDDPAGPVRARPLRDAPDIHERMGGGFYLGELWYNLSEKELFSDA